MGKSNLTDLDEHPLARVMLWLGRPLQESADVFGELAQCGGCAIAVLDDLVVQCLGHADGHTGKVRVVVLALRHLETRRGVAVAGQQREHIVLQRNTLNWAQLIQSLN